MELRAPRACAGWTRRAEIVLLERGPYVSYANCGLPYYVGGVIDKEASLLLATPEVFRGLFAIDCRTGCEVVGVSAKDKTVELKDLATGEVTTESYDKLVLSPGAAPIRPPLPGIDLPGIFPVRTVPDAAAVREWVEQSLTELPGLDSYTGSQARRRQRRAVVVGGGFIGLEMAENLIELGLDVTVVQRGDQLMAPVDREMARYVERHMENHGVHILLNDGASGFEQARRTARSRSSPSPGSGCRRTSSCSASACGRRRSSPRWRASSSASAAASASTTRCTRATRTSSPSGTRSRSSTT